MIGLVACMLMAGAPIGQIERPGAQDDIPPAIAIGALRESYQSGVIAERVVFTLRNHTGRSDRGRYEVRWDPGRRGDLEDATLRLDLADLSVWMRDERLVAVHRDVPGLYFETSFAGPISDAALASTLPPLIVPQLSLAQGSASPIAWDPISLVADVRWSEVREDRGGRGFRMTGVFDGGTITAIANRSLDAIARIDVHWTDGSRIRLDLTRLAPERRESWVIDTVGRERVDALHELAPEPGAVRVGEPISRLLPLTLENEPWSLPATEGDGVAVIAILRPASVEVDGREMRAHADAFLSRLGGATGDALAHQAILFVIDGAWTGLASEVVGGRAGVPLLWARSSNVGELSTGSMVFVIVDQEGVVRWVGEPARVDAGTSVDPVARAIEGLRKAPEPPE